MSNYFSEPCFVYILKCSDGTYYTGHTTNLNARLEAHMQGESSEYTASRRPVILVFVQQFETRDEAFWFERRLKGWARRKKESLIQNNIDQLKQFACRSKSFKDQNIT